MRGSASAGGRYLQNTLVGRVAHHPAFARPISAKLQRVAAVVVQIEAEGGKFFYFHPLSLVKQGGAAHHYVAVVKHSIIQQQRQSARRAQTKFRSFASAHARHAVKLVLVKQTVPLVTKISKRTAVCPAHQNGRTAIVAQLSAAVFQQHGVEVVVGELRSVKVDRRPQKRRLRKVHGQVTKLAAKVQMSQKTVTVCKKHVTYVFALQVKNSVFENLNHCCSFCRGGV